MANPKNIVIKVKYLSPKDQQGEPALPTGTVTEWNIKRIVIAFVIILLVIAASLYLALSKEDTPDSSAPLPEQATINTPPLPEKTAVREPHQDAAAQSGNTGMAVAPPEAETAPDQPIQFKLSEADKVVSGHTMDQIKENIKSEKNLIEATEKAKEPPITVKKKNPPKGFKEGVIRSQLASKIINKEPVQIFNSPIRVTQTKTVWIYYFTELKNMDKETIYHEWIKGGRVTYKHRINISADRWRAASRKPFNRSSAGKWQARTVDTKGHILDQKEFSIILDR